MRPANRQIQALYTLARKAPTKPKPSPPSEVRAFAQRTAAAWRQSRSRPEILDPLLLWERVAAWSLPAAVVTVVLVFALHGTPQDSNPLEPFGPGPVDEPLPFDSSL